MSRSIMFDNATSKIDRNRSWYDTPPKRNVTDQTKGNPTDDSNFQSDALTLKKMSFGFDTQNFE